jgi:hypothetical protein
MVILPQRVGKRALKINVRESVNRIGLHIKHQNATNLSLLHCLMSPAWHLSVVTTKNCKSSRVHIASATLPPKNAPRRWVSSSIARWLTPTRARLCKGKGTAGGDYAGIGEEPDAALATFAAKPSACERGGLGYRPDAVHGLAASRRRRRARKGVPAAAASPGVNRVPMASMSKTGRETSSDCT